MLYREAGQFKSSYAADMAIFPIRQDRIAMGLLLLAAFVGIPLVANQYWFAPTAMNAAVPSESCPA